MSEPNEKRKVVLGVTGSVAAVRSVEIARLLVGRGYEVRVVMDQAAEEFVTPLTFETVTGHPVLVDTWEGVGREGVRETVLADWADVIVVAPATADSIVKINAATTSSPMLITIAASKAPLLIAPVMNETMMENPRIQSHFDVLYEYGADIIFPDDQDSGVAVGGAGRMAAPWQIFYAVRRALSVPDFANKHLLITTGPTREYMDQVRYISRHSSGKMGVALAREAYRRGARVSLVHGPINARVPSEVDCSRVITAEEMYDRVLASMASEEDVPDVIVMAAAISDFSFDKNQAAIDQEAESIQLSLSRNKDVLAALREKRGKELSPLLVGFAEISGDEEEAVAELRSKLSHKDIDLLIGQGVEIAQRGGDYRVWMLDKLGHQNEVSASYKSRMVNKILDSIGRLL